MPVEALETLNEFGRTALHYAVFVRDVKSSVALVEKTSALTNILDREGWTTLFHACLFGFGSKDLVWYLALFTKNELGHPFTGPLAGSLVQTVVAAGHLGN
ncbi:Ankyrin repeat-containing domain containing protein [Parasponia andersonii]|uniref:Ankyrin repeat-containing domain containing protein n=1 Tax=Parasponia andersonii TaxID=3476 RepID=A0A2P5AXL1_PARAD|nr:Ankyrin repeat-containing domain containing protein [Parasponia andersonii]